MPTNQNNDMMVYCSFCGKSQDEVQKIIAGNNAFICNECVELAQEIIREELAEELLRREATNCQPRLVLNVPDGTNFFDIKPEDFELVDYDPVKPQLKFDLAI